MTKNDKIRESGKATRERHAQMDCAVYTVKVIENKLSKKQKEQLKMTFVEAKWLCNDIIRFAENGGIPKEYKISNYVTKLDKDGNEVEVELKHLGSQMRQAVKAELVVNIKALGALKRSGHRVGGLKYRSDYRSLNLQQVDVTYKVKKKAIKVQRITGDLPVRGLDQIPSDVEFANAHLLNTPRGYYISLTTYRPHVDFKPTIDEEIGIDMGIKEHLTLSNGKTYKVTIEETERLKKLQRQLRLKKKGSNNRRKHVKLIQREYQHITNKKNDAYHKVFHEINQYSKVVIQDEMISGWHKGLFGKQVQHSILGRIKARIVEEAKKDERFIVIERYHPTTQLCSSCGSRQKIGLDVRTYKCPECGCVLDRDVNSALNILNIGTGRTELTPVERVVRPSRNRAIGKKQEAACL